MPLFESLSISLYERERKSLLSQRRVWVDSTVMSLPFRWAMQCGLVRFPPVEKKANHHHNHGFILDRAYGQVSLPFRPTLYSVSGIDSCWCHEDTEQRSSCQDCS